MLQRPTRNEPAPGANPRLFLALWPQPDEQAELTRYLAEWSWPHGSSPAKADRLHLTLHFLGEVAQQRLPEVRAALAGAIEPFALAFNRTETWPHGLVVLCADEVPTALAQLHAALAASLHRLGLPVEGRRFRPHVTLARRAAGVAPPARPPQLRWQIDTYVLVQSILGRGGGYRIVDRYR